MQPQHECLLNCGCGQDSLEHYAECRIVSFFAQSRLGLATPPPAHKLANFLGMAPKYTEDTASEVVHRALLTYTVYAATNAARHGGTSNAVEAMSQVVKEACPAHGGLATMVADIWRSTHA